MDRMSKCRARMLLKHPFFATLMLSLNTREDNSIPTAATDMKSLIYNKDFIEGLPSDETVLFVLAHEVMHVAMEHGLRLKTRNPIAWNIACDFAINLILKESGFDVWDQALLDQKYAGMSAEEIYDLLMKDAKEQPQGGYGLPGEGNPMLGDLLEPEGAGDPAQEAKLKRGIQQSVAAAANVARMAGKLSGSLERFVDELLNPKVPWKDLLRDYMMRAAKDDETWARRNRRFRQTYLPDRFSERMGNVALIGDTSGSIGGDELKAYAGEANSILEDARPEKTYMVWADTKVAGVQEFDPDDKFTPDPKGGGGTDMRVPLEHVEQYEPEVVVLFTDGWTPWPEAEPPYPLFVCCTTDAPVPIGTVIRI